MTEVIGEVVAEETRDLPAVRAHEAMVTRAEVSVDDVVEQRDKIKAVMQRVMTDGVHYGLIPGVSKPTLYKPGAEVLNTTFRLAPSYVSERIFHDDGHLTVIAKCVLTHAPSGMVLGEGEGLCSSREAKYAYRNAKRVCPACGAEAIIKGKAEYGGGWLCWKKQDGCGAKFPDGDTVIESQEAGKAANPDLPDTWNTVLKMADKRALVAAVLNCTAASDIFTQDVEDVGLVAPDNHVASNETATADSGSLLERMRAKILNLAGDSKPQVLDAIQAAYGSPLEELDEAELAAVGTDLRAWVDGGREGDFIVPPF